MTHESWNAGRLPDGSRMVTTAHTVMTSPEWRKDFERLLDEHGQRRWETGAFEQAKSTRAATQADHQAQAARAALLAHLDATPQAVQPAPSLDDRIERAWNADGCPGQTGRELTATMVEFARALLAPATPTTAGVKTPAPTNHYRCGHCGYEGPCYGNGLSAPWCKQCQKNDKLAPIAGVDLPDGGQPK